MGLNATKIGDLLIELAVKSHLMDFPVQHLLNAG